MKRCLLLTTGLYLVLATSCAAPQSKPAGEPQPGDSQVNETYLTAELVEDAGTGRLFARGSGKGTDTATAVMHARKGILYWLATERLTQTEAEKKRLSKKMSKLMAQVGMLVDEPGPAARGGRTGIASRQTRDGVVRVSLITKVNEAQTRKLLESWGVLDEVARSAGRKLLFLLMPASTGDAKAVSIAQSILQKNLAHLPAEWLDQPKVTTIDHQSNLAAAKNASVDYLFEIAGKKLTKGEAVSWIVSLKAVDTKTGRVAAADTTVGMARNAEIPGQENKALMGAIQDSVTKLVPQFTGSLKQLSQP